MRPIVTEHNKAEIATTLMRLATLMSRQYDIRDKRRLDDYFYYSVLLEILIHLNDLLQKLKSSGNGILFSDHIPEKSKFKDVTSLINFFRNVGCHNDKKERYNSKGNLYSSNIFYGYQFDDEISLHTGDEVIFVKRHIIKVYEMVMQKFANNPILENNEEYKWAIIYADSQGIIQK